MPNRKIKIQIEGGASIEAAPATTICQLLQQQPSVAQDSAPVLGALVNHELVSLEYRIETDSHVRLLTYNDSYGERIYRHTLAFLLARTVQDLFPGSQFAVEHSLASGIYCSFSQNGHPGISPDQMDAITRHLEKTIADNLPIERLKITFEDALKHFQAKKQTDKVNLLQFKNPSKVAVYQCGDFLDLAHAPLALTAGALVAFKLTPYASGFVFLGPERDKPGQFAPFDPAPYLFQIFKEHKQWGKAVNVRTVGDLNERIARHTIDDFIDVNEAYQTKRIAQLADELAARREHVKWILVAGPSSSGKTTFTKRLTIQLRASGLLAQSISLDNYFVDRTRTPRDENGEFDFEHLETIDLALLNEHLKALDSGGEAELPYFNFETGAREFRGTKMKLGKDDIVLLEGIHALNPRLTHQIPAQHKFRIYISALTQLNLDFNNRISTTDNRLIRRIVRDNTFRGNTALTTLKMWPKVRAGEKKWIFPYQQHADVAFNSALDYELAVLRPYAEPLLSEVKPFHPQYAEALRLQQFLANFLVVAPDRVPPNSLLREFIGKSSFQY